MINYGKHYIDKNDIKTVNKVLKGNFLTQGPVVDLFQKKIKNFFNSKYCTVVSNGTAGLFIAGKALNWKKQDRIITSSMTFIASANAITLCGAKPIFLDIDPKSYNIDPNLVENELKKNKGKIKALIAVDYAGHPCDWSSLKYLANKYNFKLINDNCHALGAKINGDSGYAVKYADIVVQSYHPVKNFTTGEGGALLTNSNELNNKFLKIRNHSMIRNKKFFPWIYKIYEPGLNFRLTDIQSALGISQISKLKKFVKKRNIIAKKYTDEFQDYNCLKTPTVIKDYYHSYHLYPLQIDFKKINKTKKKLFEFMIKRNIKLQVHYIPLHTQPYYKKISGLKKGDLPNSENFYERQISLPIYPSLDKNSINKVIKSIISFIK